MLVLLKNSVVNWHMLWVPSGTDNDRSLKLDLDMKI
jgi:hypothetical protein